MQKKDKFVNFILSLLVAIATVYTSNAYADVVNLDISPGLLVAVAYDKRDVASAPGCDINKWNLVRDIVTGPAYTDRGLFAAAGNCVGNGYFVGRTLISLPTSGIPDQATVNAFSFTFTPRINQKLPTTRFVTLNGITDELSTENFSKFGTVGVSSDFTPDTSQPIAITNLSVIAKNSDTYLGMRLVDEINNDVPFNSPGDLAGKILAIDTYNFALTYTFTPSQTPSPPTIYSGSPITTSSIEWQWTDNTEQETSYHLRDSNFSTIQSFGPLVATNQMKYSESGLLANSLYTRNVACSNSLGFGSTPNFSASTLIENPSDLSVTSVWATSMTVKVNNTMSNLAVGNSGLNFTISETNQNSGWITGTSFEFTGLTPNAEYTVSVKARNRQSVQTNAFTITQFTMAIPQIPAPNNPLAAPFSAPSPDSITARWSVNGNPSQTEYLAEMSSSSDFVRLASSGWQTGTESFMAVSLSPNATWWFRVKARNINSIESDYVLLGSTATLTLPPASPQVTGVYDETLPLGYFLEIIPEFGSNNPETELAIESVDNFHQFLQGDGTVGPNKVWKTRAEWLSGGNSNREIVMIPASQVQRYNYFVHARNFNGLETRSALPGTGILPTTPLSIDKREIYDLDEDGKGETLKLTFSLPIEDNSFEPKDLALSSNLSASRTTVTGDNPNDNVLHLTLSSNLTPDQEPVVRYKGAGLKAYLSNRKLAAESTPSPAKDKVPPLIDHLSAVSANGRTVVRVRFNEDLSASSANDPASWKVEVPPGPSLSLSGPITFDGPRTVILKIPHEIKSSDLKVTASKVSDSHDNPRLECFQTTQNLRSGRHGFNIVKDAQGRRSQGAAVESAVNVTLLFDREMDPSSLQSDILLYQIQDRFGKSLFKLIPPATAEVLAGNQMLRYVPSSPLPKGSRFRVILSSSLMDAFGFRSEEENSWEFATLADYTEQTITSPLPGFTVQINPGTFSQDAGISLLTDPANNAQLTDRSLIGRAFDLEKRKAATHFPIPSLAFEIVGETAGGQPIQGALGNPVQISISYSDENNDGILDGTNPGVAVKDLELYFLDEGSREFRRAPSHVDLAAKTVTASLKHFSVYGVMGAIASTVDAFMIRPNLWKPAEDPRPIVLDNLPDASEVSIYSAAGQKVRSLQNNGNSVIEWNGTNDSGEPLGSGVYIAILKGNGGKNKRKLTIVR